MKVFGVLSSASLRRSYCVQVGAVRGRDMHVIRVLPGKDAPSTALRWQSKLQRSVRGRAVWSQPFRDPGFARRIQLCRPVEGTALPESKKPVEYRARRLDNVS